MGQVANESAFSRWAARRLRGAFATLPNRPQFNRLVRRWHDDLVAVGQRVADRVEGRAAAYPVLASMGVVTRNGKRRGRGWLAGQAGKGWCSRLLTAVGPAGASTGYGLAPAPALPTAGRSTAAPSLADAGCTGRAVLAGWRAAYGATVLAPRHRCLAPRHPPLARRLAPDQRDRP